MSASKCNMIVRTYSSAAQLAAAPMVKPPISLFGLEGRYANALYSAASKSNNLEAAEKELIKFQESAKTDVKLRSFIENPTIKRSIKVEAIKHFVSKTGMNPSAGNLLGLMAENGRLKKLNGVINAFKTIMAAHRGEVTCEVITAKALDPAQKQALQSSLKKFVKAKETIILTARVDPELIGGMIVSIGDKYVDMSIASKVKKYSELLNLPA